MFLEGSELKLTLRSRSSRFTIISLNGHLASYVMLISLHAHPTSQSPRFTVTSLLGYLPSRTLPFTFTAHREHPPAHAYNFNAW